MRKMRCLSHLALVMVASICVPALAEQTGVDVDEGPLVEVRLMRETCLHLVPHTPEPGVSYEPGVDVNGDPVAPAEPGGGSDIALPDRITIPIRLDVLTDRGLGVDRTADSDGSEAGGARGETVKPLLGEAEIGTVEIDVKQGRATFNGRPLRSEAQRRLAERCQKILSGEP